MTIKCIIEYGPDVISNGWSSIYTDSEARRRTLMQHYHFCVSTKEDFLENYKAFKEALLR